jgi:hypothetical protein
MRTGLAIRPVLWILSLLFVAVSTPGICQDSPEAAGYTYSQEQLDLLLAPIALYPDVLLSQILMASTYPLEIVEADRWVKENPQLSGDGLDSALLEKGWDTSVKSLCHDPRILEEMSKNLERTNDLGNAFLGQQDQVMETIQRLRQSAEAAGNLKSTDRQNIVTEDGYVTIEPTAPDVVYVPAYDPCWVYGPWWYPTCSPVWFWYPDLVIGPGFFFGPRYFFGRVGDWCGFSWPHRRIFVNTARTAVLSRIGVTRMHGGIETWHHDPTHRRGLAYRSPQVSRQFGVVPQPGVEARRAFRGFTPGLSAPPIGSMARPGSGRPAGGGGIERRETPRFAPQQETPRAREISPITPGPRIPQGRMEPVVPRAAVPAPSVQQFRPPGNVFEGLGQSRGEVNRQSERGRESLGGFPGPQTGGQMRGTGSGRGAGGFGGPSRGGERHR